MNEMEVWRRVQSSQSPSASIPASAVTTAATVPSQEQGRGGIAALYGFIQDEHASCAYYLRLSARFVSPPLRTKLCTIAQEERRHLKKLSALYYILTGASPQFGECVIRRDSSPLAALRRGVEAEDRAAAAYIEAASLTDEPRLAAAYRALAADEAVHAEYLASLIERMM